MDLNAVARVIGQLRQIADVLQRELDESQSGRDPLAAFFYRARKRFREQSIADHSKSGKRTREMLERLHGEAMELGFRGSIHDWHALLSFGSEWIGKPRPPHPLTIDGILTRRGEREPLAPP